MNIGVGDGAQRGHMPPPPKKKIGKIFFGQSLCKIREFSGKSHVQFGYFDNFSGNNRQSV